MFTGFVRARRARPRFTSDGFGERRPPPRPWLWLYVAVLAGLALLLVDRAHPGLVEPVRAGLLAVTAPVAAAVSDGLRPVVATAGRWIETWAAPPPAHPDAIRPDATRPQATIAALEARILALERDNAALRALVPTVESRRTPILAAPVVAGSASPVSQTLVIGAGTREGIRAGYPVVQGAHLVGRVLSARAASATVLRTIDRLSRVPVAVGDGQVRAIMVGTGDGAALQLVAPGADLAVGDVVVTSGIGGVFPRGLVVGRLASTATSWWVDVGLPDAYPARVGVLAIDDALIETGDTARETGTFRPAGEGGRR
jgi:rod shape-determining protein MreC